MLYQDIRREALQNPLMSQSLLRSEPPLRIPLEAPRNKAHEGVIRHIPQLNHDVLETFLLLSGGEHFEGRGLGVFELGKQMFSLGDLQDIRRNHSYDIDNKL